MNAAFERACEAHFDRQFAEYCDLLDEQEDTEDDNETERDDD
jgi:hypothetical protein